MLGELTKKHRKKTPKNIKHGNDSPPAAVAFFWDIPAASCSLRQRFLLDRLGPPVVLQRPPQGGRLPMAKFDVSLSALSISRGLTTLHLWNSKLPHLGTSLVLAENQQKTTGLQNFAGVHTFLKPKASISTTKTTNLANPKRYVEALAQQQAEAAGNSNILRHPTAPHSPPTAVSSDRPRISRLSLSFRP